MSNAATSAAEATLLENVRTTLVAKGAEPTAAAVAAAVRAEGRVVGRVVGNDSVLFLTAALQSELVGAGPLDALLREPGVTDVLVNGAEQVWVDRGRGLECTSVRFADEAAVRRLAVRMATVVGRRLDDASPYVDARLPGGVRLHAVVPPVSPGGTVISLRVLRSQPFTLPELIAAGALPGDLGDLVARLVQARIAFLVTGGTGTGKTTLLAALLGLVAVSERIVLVEDTGELNPAHPHVVRLEARPPNVEGAGEITLRDLVRQALRMRPDRLVVGEVRGVEAVDLLAALNTGHEGGCATLHANSASDVPARLEALTSPAGLSRAALHSQLRAAIKAVVHLGRDAAGRRRVQALHVMSAGSDRAELQLAASSAGPGPGHERLMALLGS
jgi:pilus assembly protein CpaF